MRKYMKQYNALRVTVFGDLEPLFIEDFSTSEGLGDAVGFGCTRIDAVSTRQLQSFSTWIGFPVVGFVDAHGYEKNHVPNRCMQVLSGYSMLMGPGILCGWEGNDYAPLETWQVEALIRALAEQLELPASKTDKALSNFAQLGQEEYEQGLKLAKEQPEQAHALFEQAAKLGYPDGLNAVAWDYLYGAGVPKDVEKGKTLMEQAAQMGSPKACRNIGLDYMSDDAGNIVDADKAMQYLQKAADLGDIKGMAWLAYMYAYDVFGRQNRVKALYWAQKARNKNDDIAWLTLAAIICQDAYYPYQPRHVRYCLERYVEFGGGSVEQAVGDLNETQKQAELLAAQPLEPKYPKLTREMMEASEADPYNQYVEAMTLLEHAENAQKGMALLLTAADQGCFNAMFSAAYRFMDEGQGDDFTYNEDGSVNCFPENDEKAWQYLVRTAALGETTLLRELPFAYPDFDVDLAQEMLDYYVELTGDTFVETYLLPNVKQALKLSDGGEEPPRITMQELAALEKKLPHYTREELSIPERIKRLEDAIWGSNHSGYSDAMAWRLASDPDDGQARSWENNRKNENTIRELLQVYRWIHRVQS